MKRTIILFSLLLCAAALMTACGDTQPAVVTPAQIVRGSEATAAPAPASVPDLTPPPTSVPDPTPTPTSVPVSTPKPESASAAEPSRVTASFAEDGALPEGCTEFIADGGAYSVQIIYAPDGIVTDFRVLSLFMTDFLDGKPVFDETELYFQESLTPKRPLAVTLTVAGDLPNNGISYVDSSGSTQRFALSLSGEDGSLLLEAYAPSAE